MVIATSLPAMTVNLKNISQHIEVLGFVKKQIFQYIESYPFRSEGGASEKLKSYLASNHNVFHMCYLPIHTSMICFLCDEMRGNLPPTEGGIYKEFTKFTLLRNLRLKNKKAFLKSIDDLSHEDQSVFSSACKVAFEITCSAKRIFTQDQLLQFNPDGKHESFFGFVSVHYLRGLHDLALLSFSHLTLQEYLAAYHLSKLDERMQIDTVKTIGGQKHLQAMWKFYCGLIDFQGQNSKFRMLLKMNSENLFHCHCSFESQQPSTCMEVVFFEESSSYNNLSRSSSLRSNEHVLSEENIDPEMISLPDEDLSDDLGCNYLSISGDPSENMNDHLKGSIDSEENRDPSQMSENFSHENSTSLNLYEDTNDLFEHEENDYFEVSNASLLGKCGHLNFSGQTLTPLDFNSIDYVVSRTRKVLQKLELDNCALDNTALFVNVLKHCSCLRDFTISNSAIDDNDMKNIAEGLIVCENLVALDLSGNEIGSSGAKAMHNACIAIPSS